MLLARMRRLEQVARELTDAVSFLTCSHGDLEVSSVLPSEVMVVGRGCDSSPVTKVDGITPSTVDSDDAESASRLGGESPLMLTMPLAPRANPGVKKLALQVDVALPGSLDDLDAAGEVLDELLLLPKCKRTQGHSSNTLDIVGYKHGGGSDKDVLSPCGFLFMQDDLGKVDSQVTRGEAGPARPRDLRRRIFLKLPDGATTPVDYDLTAQVSGLSDAVKNALTRADLRSGPVLCQLQFRGRVLPLHKTLQDCGIELGNVLHVKINSVYDSVLDAAASRLKL